MIGPENTRVVNQQCYICRACKKMLRHIYQLSLQKKVVASIVEITLILINFMFAKF